MKILLVNKFLYPNGGSETYIFELGKELLRQGHEVQYFGMEHEGRVVGNNAESYTSNMDFHTSKLDKLLYPFKIIYSVEARQKIRTVLDDFSPDVVHLNNINFQLTPSIIYEIRAWEKHNHRVKIVFTAHDHQWICPNHLMYIPSTGESCDRCQYGRFIECTKHCCIHGSRVKSLIGSIEGYLYKWLKTYKMVDVVICPSEYLYKRFATNPIYSNKLIMLHNFCMTVNPERLSCEIPDRYVLYVGRYNHEKGIKSLIYAAKELPEIDFVCAGSGEYDAEIRSIHNITNLGFVSSGEIRTLLEGALFTVYPSICNENCPLGVMESQMYGTPVVGSNIGGIPELIGSGDGATGELFMPGDTEEFVSIIYKLWDDGETLKQYTDKCRMVKWYSVSEYVEKLMEVYRG